MLPELYLTHCFVCESIEKPASADSNQIKLLHPKGHQIIEGLIFLFTLFSTVLDLGVKYEVHTQSFNSIAFQVCSVYINPVIYSLYRRG